MIINGLCIHRDMSEASHMICCAITVYVCVVMVSTSRYQQHTLMAIAV